MTRYFENLFVMLVTALSFLAVSCGEDGGNPPDTVISSSGNPDSGPMDDLTDTMSDDTSTPNPDTESPPDTNDPPDIMLEDPCEAYEVFGSNPVYCCGMNSNTCFNDQCTIAVSEQTCKIACPEATAHWDISVDDESYWFFEMNGDPKYFVTLDQQGEPKTQCTIMQ